MKYLYNFFNLIGSGFLYLGISIKAKTTKLIRNRYGYSVKCKHCHKDFKALITDFEEDEYEEPYGGFSTYLVTKCPHCGSYTEPESEIYKEYYQK